MVQDMTLVYVVHALNEHERVRIGIEELFYLPGKLAVPHTSSVYCLHKELLP
jgi:hypothetical protein